MALFESEIQELIYEILTSDAVLSAYLGGDGSDNRIYLCLGDSETAKVSESQPAFVVIETMPVPAPVRLGNGIDNWTERYCLHVFTKPESRELRANIEGRFRADFHRKKFATTSYIIYHVFEDGREGELTEGGLYDHKYFVLFQFLPKS